MTRAFIPFLIFLGGCASGAGVDEGTSHWVGHSLDQVVAAYGSPNAQRDGQGNTVYQWKTDAGLTRPTLVSGTINGTVSNPPYGTDGMTLGSSAVSMPCTLSVEISKNVVVKASTQGTMEACAKYADIR